MPNSLRLFAALLVAMLSPATLAAEWLATRWNGESAYAFITSAWSAVVSLERGRLVHFGPRDGSLNLLASDADKNGEEGFGGHRLWFGPQQSWSKEWPPPKAWELSAAASWSVQKETLVLEMPPSPDGWPDLVREYRVEGDKLICAVRFQGGTREAQAMQILQTPPATVTRLQALRDARTGESIRILKGAKLPAAGKLPEHVMEANGQFTIRFVSSPIKLAFATQAIKATHEEWTLVVSKGAERGEVASEPDDGLYTQLYLGAPKNGNVVELEQMSPAFKPGTGGYAEMVLELRR